MSELRSGTETTDPGIDGAGDTDSEASPGAGHDGNRAAQAAEDRLPLRQDAWSASWNDAPDYDEADFGGEYDGNLAALTTINGLPPRQDSWSAGWSDAPGSDETALEGEHGGDLEAPTADDHVTVTGEEPAPDGGDGDQGQAAPDEVPLPTGEPGDPPAETAGASVEAAPRQEDGNVTAPGSSPGGASANTGSAADAGTEEQPGEAAQAGRADALPRQAGQQATGSHDHDAAGAADGQSGPAGDSRAADEPALASQAQASTDSTSVQAMQPTDATEGEVGDAAAADASATEQDRPTGPGQQDAAGTETRPDQRDGEQVWAAFEQRLQAVEGDRDQLRQEVSELKADRDASEARHKAQIDSIKAEYEARISDLEVTAAARQQEQQNLTGDPPDSGGQLEQVNGDGTSDDAGLADVDALVKSFNGGSDRDTQAPSGRPIVSPEEKSFVKSAVGLWKSAGLPVPPGTDIILNADSTREAFAKMPPEHQDKFMRLAGIAGTLSGMPPDAGLATAVVYTVGPGVIAKLRDVIHKMRHRND